MKLVLFWLACASALRLPVPSRRAFIGAAATAAFSPLPVIADDSIAEIAERTNEAAASAREQKIADDAAREEFTDVAEPVLATAIGVAAVGIIGLTGQSTARAVADVNREEAARFTRDVGGNTPAGYQSTFSSRRAPKQKAPKETEFEKKKRQMRAKGLW